VGTFQGPIPFEPQSVNVLSFDRFLQKLSGLGVGTAGSVDEVRSVDNKDSLALTLMSVIEQSHFHRSSLFHRWTWLCS
jgi:hypothetical protein